MKTTLPPLLVLALALSGSAHAQSANEMWTRDTTLATRKRVDRELDAARAEGIIRRWSPDAIVLPLKPTRRSSVILPFAASPRIEHWTPDDAEESAPAQPSP
jgi:hypothetical protein